MNALQRPLFQDGDAGVHDFQKIGTILRGICHTMTRVRISVPGDPVLYESYIGALDVAAPPGKIRLDYPLWDRIPEALQCGCRLVISFCHREKAYFFSTRVSEILRQSMCAPLPPALQFYPYRKVPRIRAPLPVPATVKFRDPRTNRALRVCDMEDMAYLGLSFRMARSHPMLSAGMKIPRLDVCSFERRWYSTSATVEHTRSCCDFSGGRYERVGLVFQEGAPFGPDASLAWNGEDCKQIVDRLEIQQSLQDLLKYRIPIALQDMAKRKSEVFALPGPSPADEESLLRFHIQGSGQGRSPFAGRQAIRARYVMHGSVHGFFSSVCSATKQHVVIRVPDRIVRFRRRRSPRQIRPAEKSARVQFKIPLLEKEVDLPLLDLSEKGLSIALDFEKYLLFPGTRIREARLALSGRTYALPGIRVQWVDKACPQEGRGRFRVGIVFEYLPESVGRVIFETLAREDHPAFVRPGPQMISRIWDLHYRSGFVYRRKHESLTSVRKEIDQTWRRLHSPETRFFINISLVRDDRLLGSGTMVQVYEDTWLLQHLSALAQGSITVNKEINVGLLEESMRDPRIRYIRTFFRKNNPWPNKHFRMFALQHLKPALYDLTLYRYYEKDPRPIPVQGKLPQGVSIQRLGAADHEAVRNYFMRRGKVLVARSESLFGPGVDLPVTSKLYRERHLRRQRRIFTAKLGSRLLGFVLAEDASLGVNLSGLLNLCRFHALSPRDPLVGKVLPFLLNEALAFYGSLRYPKVRLMAEEDEPCLPTQWGFDHVGDYYCLTVHRNCLFEYLHYIRERYGRAEFRRLTRCR